MQQLHFTNSCTQWQHGKFGRRASPCLRHSLLVRSAAANDPTSSQDEDSKQDAKPSTASKPQLDIAFPKRGLFSIADPNQEVYSKAGERFDPQKKGGRFKPEFIWQTNWQEQLKRQEDLERQQEQYRQRQKEGGITGGTGPGVVSFSRLGSLDDPNIDLTEELRKAQQRQQKEAAAAAARQAAAPSSSSSRRQQQQPRQQQTKQRQRGSAAAAGASPSYEFKDMPTRLEARRFKRSSRSAPIGTAISINAVGAMSPEETAARAAAAAAAKARYEKLKLEFQAWAVGLGLLGTVSCFYLYTNDVAISYALGASGGLIYLRLLSRTVDSVGDQGAKGTIGQPRLLIPVLLALTYNRWNLLYADTYGFHLNFYAMLVGFFTYKLAVLGRQGLELLGELSEPASSSSGGAGGAAGQQAEQGEGGGDSAMDLDRIFIRKALSE